MSAFEKIVYCVMTVVLSFGSTYMTALLTVCFTRRKRKHFAAKFGVSIAVYAAIVVFFNLNYFAHVVEFSDGFAAAMLWIDEHLQKLVLLFILCAATAIAALCFEMSVKETVFLASSSYLIQHVPVCIYAGIRSLAPSVNYWLFAAIYVGVYALYYFLFVRRIRNNAIETDNTVVILTALASAAVIFLFEYLFNIDYALAGNIYQVLACFVMLFLLFGYFRQGRIESEKEKLETLLRAEQKHYESMSLAMEAIDRKSHDLKYLVSALKETDDDIKRGEMLESLTREVDTYANSNLTDNKALNTILAEKYAVCENLGVKLYCIIDGKLLDFMDINDMYSLFGNAVDNAIEHVKKCADESKKYISIKVKPNDGFVSIHFENALDGELDMVGGKPRTTKKDKSLHGYGLKSIEYVVKKYGGEMSISSDGGLFVLNLIIPRET